MSKLDVVLKIMIGCNFYNIYIAGGVSVFIYYVYVVIFPSVYI